MPGQEAEAAAGHLGPQVGTLVDGPQRLVHQLAPQVGRGVDLDEGEGDRAVDGGRQPAHPVDLELRGHDVLAGRARRGQLEDAGAQFAERGADAEQLVLGGVGAGDRLAVDGQVGDGARRREAEGAGGDRLLDHLLHGGDVGRGGRLVAGAALAHHVGADGAVGDLGADVDGPAALVEGVEVLGEGLPVPRHALGEGGSRDVLDALHETDQPLVPVGTGRSEPDAAVAGDQCGDAVPAARCQHLVPGGLAVVVGVDVDPSGGDQQAFGVDRAGRRLAPVVAHAGDDAAAHGDVRGPGGRSGAVDDGAPLDDEIVHGGVSPSGIPSGCTRRCSHARIGGAMRRRPVTGAGARPGRPGQRGGRE